jgi:hypothetical protein
MLSMAIRTVSFSSVDLSTVEISANSSAWRMGRSCSVSNKSASFLAAASNFDNWFLRFSFE